MQEKFSRSGKRNMEYSIKLTDEFLNEVDAICDYITNILKAPDASNRLREKVMYNVLLLEESPKIFTEIEKIDNEKRIYRRIPVNNYVILYTIDENNKTIYVAHIYYGGRNYLDNNLL